MKQRFDFDSRAPLAGEKPPFSNRYSTEIAIAVMGLGAIACFIVYKVFTAASAASGFAHWLMPSFF